MKVPFLDLQAHWQEAAESYTQIHEQILETGQWQGDATTEPFEKELAAYCRRDYAIAVSSGTDALVLALRALRLPPGSGVMLPAFTFVATGSAVLQAGLEPVFVDVNRNGRISQQEIDNFMDDDIKVLIDVNMFGLARSKRTVPKGITMICDNAQGFDKDSCAEGAMNILSFDPMKTLPAFGSAGAILCDEVMLAFFLKGLRKNDPYSEGISTNAQCSATQAASLKYKLTRHPAWCKELKMIAQHYGRNLMGVQLFHDQGSNHKYVIRHKRRNQLKEFLAENGIETKIHYPYILPELPMFGKNNKRPYAKHLYPTAKNLSETCLSLPIYPTMGIEKAQYVVDKITDFCFQNGDSTKPTRNSA